MIILTFHVIQLLKLMILSCAGKSPTAEHRAKDSVLSFKVAKSIIQMSDDFGLSNFHHQLPLALTPFLLDNEI
jgi:hypothetical protein